MINRHVTQYLALLFCLVAGVAVPMLSVAQENGALITQEYFIQQAVDEDLLITISAFEAEFESKISAQKGQVLLVSGLTGSRMIPVFQYVSAPTSNRQLDIEVSSTLHTKRSEFGLGLTRLKVWDERSNSVSRAYRLLSFGMESNAGASEADWTVKIDSLINAGRLFQQFGMNEMRLWANFLAAHLIQEQLHDFGIVYSMTREILDELKGARFQKIELAVLQLQSAALIGLKTSGNLNVRANQPDPVQSVLMRAAVLAKRTGFLFEQASALSASAAEYASDGLYAQALEQYQLAVQIADAVGDPELATVIRENIVDIHTTQGNAPATGEVLREIETQLQEESDGDELALNLLAQGRLYINSYRYDQAVGVLYRALDFQNHSAIRRQVNYELAKIFYATGRFDESLAYLKLARVTSNSSQQKSGSTVVNIGEGLWMMANIQRLAGDFGQMRETRIAQGQYQNNSARFLYEQGLDELAQSRSKQKAKALFNQSYLESRNTTDVDYLHLSRLQYCALGAASDALCSGTKTKTAYQSLVSSGVPGYTTQAMFLWAQILSANGQRSDAIRVLDRLLDEIHFLRHTLPGVLNTWYNDQHQQVFEYYLDTLTKGSSSQGGVDGALSLLALSKIRLIEKYSNTGSMVETGYEGSDLIRVQLAQRANTGSARVPAVLVENINKSLAGLRNGFRSEFEYLTPAGLQKYLAGLSSDEVVLTYHVSAVKAQVWVANRTGVEQRNIANPTRVYATLSESGQDLADGGISSFNGKMEMLGRQLITPVADLLKENIYLIPAGPLLALPLDAARVNGQYLFERFSVLNLVSFPSNPEPSLSVNADAPNRIFVAGYPQDYSSDYATRLVTSTEISVVANIFVGPGLQIIQGVALLPDEFRSENFQQANLVHMAMPGVIDLKFPGRSNLELSGSEFSSGREMLLATDIRSQKSTADLVFLSGTRVTERPKTGFASHPGLVTDFLDAGAKSVIASQWASSGEASEAFIAEFYRLLQDSGNIAHALQTAKLKYLSDNYENGLFDATGFQLYIQ